MINLQLWSVQEYLVQSRVSAVSHRCNKPLLWIPYHKVRLAQAFAICIFEEDKSPSDVDSCDCGRLELAADQKLGLDLISHRLQVWRRGLDLLRSRRQRSCKKIQNYYFVKKYQVMTKVTCAGVTFSFGESSRGGRSCLRQVEQLSMVL